MLTNRLLLVLPLAALSIASSPALAGVEEDKKACFVGSVSTIEEDRLATCTRLIESKALNEKDIKEAYRARGALYLDFYRDQEAKEDFDHAGDGLANFYIRTGAYESAAKLLDDDVRGVQRLYERDGGGANVMEKYRLDVPFARRLYAETTYARRMLVNYFLRKPDAAAQDFASAMALDPGNLRVLESRCKGLAFLGDFTHAAADCDSVIGNPKFGVFLKSKTVDYDVFITRGVIKIRLGKLDEAAADFEATREHSNFLSPEALYGRGIVKRLQGRTEDANVDIAHAKEIYPRVGTYFAQFAIPDSGPVTPTARVGSDEPRALFHASMYVRFAKYIEVTDHRCSPMYHAANFYFNAAGGYLQAGKLEFMGPLVRRALEIHKRVREIWGVLDDVHPTGDETNAQFQKLNECVSDLPDFSVTAEPFTCKTLEDYERLSVELRRFNDRLSRKEVMSQAAFRSLAALGCGKPAAEPSISKTGPVRTLRDCAECPEMVVVPAGQFMMGSPPSETERQSGEGPQHIVSIPKPFAVGKFPVTIAEWQACVRARGCANYDSRYSKGLEGTSARHPATHVAWKDAKQYASWLSRRTGKPYRLLSESEFEYAARAGTTTKYPWGDDIGVGNAACKGCGSAFTSTAPVGSFKPNGFGLYDMEGNVTQWVEDTFHQNYDGAPADGSAWVGDLSSRITRGGSNLAQAEGVRAARRNSMPEFYQNGVIGFRVARTLDDGAPVKPSPSAAASPRERRGR